MTFHRHIAVNARLLLPNRLEGIGYFAHETLKRITTANPETKFTFLFDRPFDAGFVYGQNVFPVVLPPQARHPLLYMFWFEVSVRHWLKKNQPDLFLSPDGYGVLNTSVPQLLVMHDLAYIHYPAHMGKADEWYYRFFMPRFAQKAQRIATVSEFSKQEMVAHLNVPNKKVDVVYNGIRDVFKPITEGEKLTVRAKVSGGKPYLVYIGSLNPRKNLASALLAFEKMESKRGDKFLIVGAKGWKTDELFKVWKQMQKRNDVQFLGRLTDSELAQTLAAAEALVYPSLFEGFGVPPLEAMACGVPVIVSNTSSLPEVCGSAALYVSPTNVDDISAKMKFILENEAAGKRLAALGFAQQANFSWQRSANLLQQSVNTVLGGCLTY